MDKQKRLVLIDGHAMLYRAWFAFPQTLTKRDGTIINAVYGFTRILLTAIEELHPEYLAVSFDVGRTFRHDMYKEYKAHREKMPEELKIQEPLTYEVVGALNIPIFTKEGFEADDVIGTLAKQASKTEVETVIVTGDKDVLQLVDNQGRVKVYMPARINKPAVTYEEKTVKEDLGVTPFQIPDYKGLAGDSSDNIPGVRGVGPKTAVKLLQEYQSLEGVYEHVDDLLGSVKQKVVEGKEMAFKSKELATIITDVPIKLDLEAAMVKAYDKTKVVRIFEEYEFRSLINKLPKDAFEESVQEALF